MTRLLGARPRTTRQSDRPLSIPPLDGPLVPNSLLDEADLVGGPLPNPVDLAVDSGGVLWAAAGGSLWSVTTDRSAWRERLSPPGSRCVALTDRGADLAVATDEAVYRVSNSGLTQLPPMPAAWARCVTDLSADPEGGLWATIGSDAHDGTEWGRALLERSRSGLLVRLAPGDERWSAVTDRLAWPAGVLAESGSLVIAEAGAHRVSTYRWDGSLDQVVLENLPGYPGRVCAAADGGLLLCISALRTHLLEFIMREPKFLRAMCAEIDPEHWIQPRLRAPRTPLAPQQVGAVATTGTIRPWAPPQSYGLLIVTDADRRPVRSYHSRADGNVHGLTSAVAMGGTLLASSYGHNRVLDLGAPDA